MASAYATSLFADLKAALEAAPPDPSISGSFLIVVGRDVRVLLNLGVDSRVDTVRFLGPTEAAPVGVPCIKYRDDGVLADIFERRLRPDVAWASGAISINGDMAAAAKLRRVFELVRRYRSTAASGSSVANPATGATVGDAANHASPARFVRTAAETDLGLSPASAATDIEDHRAAGVLAQRGVPSSGPLAIIDRSMWQPDGVGCSRCGARYSLARRRHHCRFCGMCVCSACSPSRLSGERACDGCAATASQSDVAAAAAPPSLRRDPSFAAASAAASAAAEAGTASHVAPVLQQPHQHTAGTPDRKESWLGLDRMLPGSASAPASRSASIAPLHTSADAAEPWPASSMRPAHARPAAGAGVAPTAVSAGDGVTPPAVALRTSSSPDSAGSAAEVAALVHEHEREVFQLRASVETLEGHVRALSEAAANEGADKLQAQLMRMFMCAAVVHVALFFAVLNLLLLPHVAPFIPASFVGTLLLWAVLMLSLGIYPLLNWLSAHRLSRFCLAICTAGVILLGLRNLRRRTAGMSDAESDPLWNAAHAIYARFAYRQMLYLKAFWLKLAQYVGARSDVFPPAYVKELSKLSDATEATPFAQVRAVIEAELRSAAAAASAAHGPSIGISGSRSSSISGSSAGSVCLEDVFELFDEAPLASASIAQVHKARLRVPITVPVPKRGAAALGSASSAAGSGAAVSNGNGTGNGVQPEVMLVRDVVCKVQHAGVAPIMLSDLTALKAIVRFVAWVEPEFDFRPVISEWAAEAVKELDFRREAAITAHVGRAVAAAGVRARVPAVIDIRALLSGASSSSSSSNAGISSTANGVAAGSTVTTGATPSAAHSVTVSPSGFTFTFPVEFAFATPRVLVAEFVNGLRVTDIPSLDAARVDKQALARDVCEAFAVAMHVDGVFSGDPHSGNLASDSCESVDLPVHGLLVDAGREWQLPINGSLVHATFRDSSTSRRQQLTVQLAPLSTLCPHHSPRAARGAAQCRLCRQWLTSSCCRHWHYFWLWPGSCRAGAA